MLTGRLNSIAISHHPREAVLAQEPEKKHRGRSEFRDP
jgi:hypothetical protein